MYTILQLRAHCTWLIWLFRSKLIVFILIVTTLYLISFVFRADVFVVYGWLHCDTSTAAKRFRLNFAAWCGINLNDQCSMNSMSSSAMIQLCHKINTKQAHPSIYCNHVVRFGYSNKHSQIQLCITAMCYDKS